METDFYIRNGKIQTEGSYIATLVAGQEGADDLVRRANAAPDLLEALESARSAMYHRLPGKDWDQLAPVIAQIDAAIAKAKGEA